MSPTELKIRQRHLMKSKDKKKFLINLQENFGGNEETVTKIVSAKSKIEWVKLDQNQELFAIDDVMTFWLVDGIYIPLLSYLMKYPNAPFKYVIVDHGAIKFVSKGADVMRPGITTFDPKIKKGDVVLVKDPVHNRVLSVGQAMYDTDEMEAMTKGKVLKCIHSLTDAIWQFSKNF